MVNTHPFLVIALTTFTWPDWEQLCSLRLSTHESVREEFLKKHENISYSAGIIDVCVLFNQHFNEQISTLKGYM